MGRLILGLILVLPLMATDYTVKTSGGDYSEVSTCINAISPGDRCVVSSGSYSSITVSNSGTSGNPITAVWDGLSTKPSLGGGINLGNEDYVTFDGLIVNGGISNDSTASASSFIQLLNLEIEGAGVGVNLRADDVLISGCTFNDMTNDMVRHFGSRWTIRNNVMVNETDSSDVHMDMWQSYCSPDTASGDVGNHGLIENNTYMYVAGGNVHFALVNDTNACDVKAEVLIWRYNTVHYIGSTGVSVDNNSVDVMGERNAIYNNTFGELNEGVHATWRDYCCNMDASINSRGLNNLFYDAMDPTGTTGFNTTSGWSQSYNLYYDPGGTMTFGGGASSETGAVKNQDPLFTDYAKDDFTLQAESPAVDAGGPLTTVAVADTGTGTSLVVNAAYMFQPGWGGASPDWIAVGTVGNTVEIASIDYDTNTITLANSISREDADPVYLYKDSDGTVVLYGTAPDIGAYELDAGGGTAPTITTTTLPDGQVGVAYSETLAATGDATIVWTCCAAGALPDGLSLATDGDLTGTPTVSDTFNFTVTATNDTGNDTQALSLTINPSNNPSVVSTGTVSATGAMIQ